MCSYLPYLPTLLSLLLQCGPQHDNLWNKAEQETELAKQEACNVKQLTSEKREAGQRVEQANKEVGAELCRPEASTLAYEGTWLIESDPSHTDMLGLGQAMRCQPEGGVPVIVGSHVITGMPACAP